MGIKQKLNNFGLEVKGIAKLKPIIFITMAYGLIYGLAASVISTVQLSFYIGIIGSYSIILAIAKFYGLKKYRMLQGRESTDDTKSIERNTAKNIAICVAAMSFLHFSFAIVSTFFYEESPSNYGIWVLFFSAGAAFFQIAFATIQSIRTRKNHSKIIHHIRLADNANALIMLSLTQRSILYFVGEEYAKVASGIGGILFSLCAGAICLGMFLKYRKKEKIAE
jgi:hypothetical protein